MAEEYGRYMCVSYYQKPNGNWDEYTEFKNNLNKGRLQTAKVILDFKNKSVVKNGLNPEATFYDMLDLYKKQMGDQLTPHIAEEFR